MGNLMTQTGYNPTDTLIGGTTETIRADILSGAGSLERGQVMAFDTSNQGWTAYVSGGSNGTGTPRGVLNEDADASAAAVVGAEVIITADELINTGLEGIDFVLDTDELATPDAPVCELVAGGTLAATTLHTYKVTGIDVNDGITAPSATDGETTVAASAGSVAGLVVADIAAVNAALGNCSVTSKVVQFTVDGVANSATFSLDYSGAGALGNHAALVTALELTSSGMTATSSDGAAITLTSDTTGADSLVRITSDTTGLFSSPTYTDGVALSKTIKVTVPELAGAEDYKVWRTTDAGSTWAYREMTDAEIALGYFVDDGTLTWTSGTPVLVTDWAGIMALFDRKILITGLESGYELQAD